MTIQAWVSHFVIAPPLIVTKEQIDFGVDLLDKHLAMADEHCTVSKEPETVSITSDS